MLSEWVFQGARGRTRWLTACASWESVQGCKTCLATTNITTNLEGAFVSDFRPSRCENSISVLPRRGCCGLCDMAACVGLLGSLLGRHPVTKATGGIFSRLNPHGDGFCAVRCHQQPKEIHVDAWWMLGRKSEAGKVRVRLWHFSIGRTSWRSTAQNCSEFNAMMPRPQPHDGGSGFYTLAVRVSCPSPFFLHDRREAIAEDSKRLERRWYAMDSGATAERRCKSDVSVSENRKT